MSLVICDDTEPTVHQPPVAPTTVSDRTAERVAVAAIVCCAAIFGFFYAWVCSTMWGLGTIDPRAAIEAMQGMNASVRNVVFFPAFFLTPVLLAVVGVLMHRSQRRGPARWFYAAAVVYAVGGLLLTMAVNVPMNDDLATVQIPTDIAAAATIWDEYSSPLERGANRRQRDRPDPRRRRSPPSRRRTFLPPAHQPDELSFEAAAALPDPSEG